MDLNGRKMFRLQDKHIFLDLLFNLNQKKKGLDLRKYCSFFKVDALPKSDYLTS